MKKVPYHGNPGNACALACYTMVAQYLFPDDESITFGSLGKLANWQKGYVVWGFSIWDWLMDKGVRITDYDIFDMEAWADKGLEGLRNSVSEKEFKFIQENTYDLEAVTKEASKTYNHPNLTYVQKKLSWDDIVNEVRKPGICDITLDGRKLHRTDGFSIHRVVIVDISEDEVIFHDPVLNNSGAYTHEPISHFRNSVESLSGPELARYVLPSKN